MVVGTRIDDLTRLLFERADAADEAGRLTPDMAAAIRDAGVIRMLQPKEFGGTESHPVEFFESLLAVGAAAPSAGWVCGVVGVHPFEIAQADLRVQEEIWGEDPDVWIASPYAPFGKAVPVDGGYVFSGRWPFSSGTDNCDWVVIGGRIVDADGKPEADGLRHFVLDKSQYEVDQDSWDVVGLKSTGSKDLIVTDVFVPAYRVIDPRDLVDGSAAERAGRTNPLYRMNWYVMFTAAITAAMLAMAEGALTVFVNQTRDRVKDSGVKAAQDPHMLGVLGAVSADVQASRVQLLGDISEMWDLAQAGHILNEKQRIEFRRNQVRVSRRMAQGVEDLYTMAGGSGIRMNQPLQRYWRDIHAGINHSANLAAPIYEGHSAVRFGDPLPSHIRL